MPSSSFQSGDTVALKSGGPVMTIRRIEDDKAFCEWFDNKDKKAAMFALTQLVKKDV